MLATEMSPVVVPAALGVKLAAKVALCPTLNVKGNDGPLTPKPPPDAETWLIVTASAPEFVRVRL